MRRHFSLALLSVLVAGFFWLFPNMDVEAGKKKVAKFRPAKTFGKLHKVQTRSPQWKAITIAPNGTVAQAIKRKLNRQGWNVQMRSNSAGQVAIRARMLQWRTRAIVPNPIAAQQLAAVLRAQGFAARIR